MWPQSYSSRSLYLENEKGRWKKQSEQWCLPLPALWLSRGLGGTVAHFVGPTASWVSSREADTQRDWTISWRPHNTIRKRKSSDEMHTTRCTMFCCCFVSWLRFLIDHVFFQSIDCSLWQWSGPYYARIHWLIEWMNGWVNEWPMTSKGPSLSRDLWNLPYVLGLMRLPAALLGWRASLFLLLWTKAVSPGCPPLMRGHSPRGLRLQANYFQAVLATGFKICRLLLVSYI